VAAVSGVEWSNIRSKAVEEKGRKCSRKKKRIATKIESQLRFSNTSLFYSTTVKIIEKTTN
jgi:hypothetical protein